MRAKGPEHVRQLFGDGPLHVAQLLSQDVQTLDDGNVPPGQLPTHAPSDKLVPPEHDVQLDSEAPLHVGQDEWHGVQVPELSK